jgi:hypothetical protein
VAHLINATGSEFDPTGQRSTKLAASSGTAFGPGIAMGLDRRGDWGYLQGLSRCWSVAETSPQTPKAS